MGRANSLSAACLYFDTLLQTYSHTFRHTHSCARTYLYPPPPTHPLMLHPPQHALTYVYMCFRCVLRKWTDLQATDIIWTISDTGWILNMLSSFLEPWTSGACTFIHHLPTFDPLVILKVRGDSGCTRRSEQAQGLHTPIDGRFFQVICCLRIVATWMASVQEGRWEWFLPSRSSWSGEGDRPIHT